MKLTNASADVFVPDGVAVGEALGRTTYLAIGAHQDDLEFMAVHGVLECFGKPDMWFTGVTCTNGAGSPRSGVYAGFTDQEMQKVRRVEQRTAASIGRYAAMFQLDHPSSVVKNPANPALSADLREILQATRPRRVYTHNPADKHDTHVAVMGATLAALRSLPAAEQPEEFWGCEVWRDLDWLPDSRKVLMDVSARQNLQAALSGVYDSQISGGKRYDVAAAGRHQANATFFESHGVDSANLLAFGMDLTPLLRDPKLTVSAYVEGLIAEFKADVTGKLSPWK